MNFVNLFSNKTIAFGAALFSISFSSFLWAGEFEREFDVPYTQYSSPQQLLSPRASSMARPVKTGKRLHELLRLWRLFTRPVQLKNPPANFLVPCHLVAVAEGEKRPISLPKKSWTRLAATSNRL